MLDITLRRPSAVPRQLLLISIEPAMILNLRSPEGANPPYTQPLPIDTAWESFQRVLRHLADVSVVIIRSLYRLNKVQLRAPRALRYNSGFDALPFELLIRPGGEKKVSRAGHDRARTGEEHVREGVAHGTDAEFVARVVFPEKIDDIEHLPALALRVIQPHKRRHHYLTFSGIYSFRVRRAIFPKLPARADTCRRRASVRRPQNHGEQGRSPEMYSWREIAIALKILDEVTSCIVGHSQVSPTYDLAR